MSAAHPAPHIASQRLSRSTVFVATWACTEVPLEIRNLIPAALVLTSSMLLAPAPASADVFLCDSAYASCRARLRTLIANETIGIDAAYWYMRDLMIVNALIAKHKAGVAVRVMVDPSAEAGHPGSTTAINYLKNGGVPLRRKIGSGVLHWKMMIFAGQQILQFGASNLSAPEWECPNPLTTCRNENNEFEDDPDLINSFKTRFDDYWVNTTLMTNYANMTAAAAGRRYPVFPIDTRLSIQPYDAFSTRLIGLIDRETAGVDANVLRFEQLSIVDALIRAHKRGVPVRINTEFVEYREPKRPNVSFALDKLWVNGVPLKWRANSGNNHEKVSVFHGQRVVVTGSSNYGSSADKGGNMENNLFTDPLRLDVTRLEFYTAKFAGRWDNTRTINGVTWRESRWFAPGSPGMPTYVSPLNASFGGVVTGLKFLVTWAHYVDVYLDTASIPTTLIRQNMRVGANTTVTIPLSGLTPGVTYYWKVVTRTAALKTQTGAVWSFEAQ